MTRTMYDAVTPSQIPANAQMVAGYVDGIYAWHANDWARFPDAVKVRIAVFSRTNDGHVLDIEPGCSTPASAPGWVLMRRRAGVDPSVYCNTSTLPTVQAAFRAAGVPEPHYWIASYPGIGAALYAGSVAHQYADPGPVDISVVADYWPGVDGASNGAGGIVSGTVHIPSAPIFPDPTQTAPPIQEDDDMDVYAFTDTKTKGTGFRLRTALGETDLGNMGEVDACMSAINARVTRTMGPNGWELHYPTPCLDTEAALLASKLAAIRKA